MVEWTSGPVAIAALLPPRGIIPDGSLHRMLSDSLRVGAWEKLPIWFYR